MIKDNMVIARTERMLNSTNANPRFMIVFTDGTAAPTGVDCSVAYGITNPEFRDSPLLVEYDRKGHIIYVRTMDGRFQA